VCVNNNSMSSIALRRLAITCRSTSSIYRNQRTFTTSLPLFTETNSGNSVDSPRTVTIIPGKHIRLLISHNHAFPFKVMVLVQKLQIVFKKYLMLQVYRSIGNRSM
jgi:hypothetical protein